MNSFFSCYKSKFLSVFFIISSLALSGCAQNFTPITKQATESTAKIKGYTDQLEICQIFQREPTWYGALSDMESAWGTPIPLAMAFVKQESSFIHDARPIKRNNNGEKIGYKSSAYGYAQALDGTWSDFEKATKRSVERTDFADAMQFIGWYTSLSKKELGLSYRNIEEHYLAYHEGRGGFKRGRHKGKTALLNIAKKVEKQAKTYKKQLKSCQRRLEKQNRLNLVAKK